MRSRFAGVSVEEILACRGCDSFDNIQTGQVIGFLNP